MGKHSAIGPSSCSQFWNCPGSVELQRGIPNVSSSYAREGTAAHALAAVCLQRRRDPLGYVGETFEDGDDVHEITEEMAEAVKVYYDAVLKAYNANVKKGETCVIEVEKELSNPSIDPEAFGTCDCFFVTPNGKLFVFDYKHGAGVAVDAVDNKQMLYYAALGLDYVLVDEVILTIVQPRAKDDPNSIKEWRVTADDVSKFTAELKAKIKETKAKHPITKTGSWCRFCRAQPQCPAFTKTLVSMFPQESKDDALPTLPLDKYGEMYCRALVFKSRFDSWFKQLGTLLYTYAEAGTPAPGTKLVEGRKTRKWSDEKAAEAALSEYGDVIYTPKKLKSPAEMEKVVDKEEVAELVDESRPLKLAPDSDSREAVKT
ncbi:MAG: DUF2800 domain-containing protein, partial [Actinobacteria bacterium]|nr:DUF2800 domain-containing protein [Actinomycetota bacterium]